MAFAVLICCTLPSAAQKITHKSEAEVSRMTSEELVKESCDEYYHHSLWHREYMDMLYRQIMKDGAKAIPALANIVNEFDPTTANGKNREQDAYEYEAQILLADIDGRVIRLRALDEGRKAIEAVAQAVDRMRAAHFDSAPDKGEYSVQARFETAEDLLKSMQGFSRYDDAIRNALLVTHEITFSDDEMLRFVNYLIVQDPSYSKWSDTTWYRDLKRRNEAGNPLQYSIVKNVERFYGEYLKFKAR
jgi:hypothetical protein